MEVISVESPQFKHQQVEAGIRQLIATLPVGARLPSERNLAVSFGCNFLTVRRALRSLVADGIVTRKVGSGTFVAKALPAVQPQALPKRIGVLARPDGGGHAHRILQGIALGAETAGVEIRSAWVRDLASQGLEQAEAMSRDGCAAIILPWVPHHCLDEVRDFVRHSPLPVSLPLPIPGLETNCFEHEAVFRENLRAGCEQLCEYFRLLGRRRIAFLGPDDDTDPVLQGMLAAHLAYASRHGLPALSGLVRPGGQAMDELAENWRGHRGDLAILCYDDEHALRFITAMHKLGLSAPDDFQIIGRNGSDAGAFSDPPLTTLRQNFSYIGLWLIRNALGLAQGAGERSSAPPPPELLIRASCGGAGRVGDKLREQLPGLRLVDGDPDTDDV
jgi:Transcriptional regulators